MRILIWHLHGSWLTSFVQGGHDYLVPVLPGRGPYGLGRARTWDWPPNVIEVTPEQLGTEPVDVVVAQRPRRAGAGRLLARPAARSRPARRLPGT